MNFVWGWLLSCCFLRRGFVGIVPSGISRGTINRIWRYSPGYFRTRWYLISSVRKQFCQALDDKLRPAAGFWMLQKLRYPFFLLNGRNCSRDASFLRCICGELLQGIYKFLFAMVPGTRMIGLSRHWWVYQCSECCEVCFFIFLLLYGRACWWNALF
jgi:hypothetical protein